MDTYLNQGKSPLDSPGFDERFAAFLTDEEKQNELMIEAVPSFADFVAREYPPIAAQRDRVKKAHERREKSKPKN
ncbi:MAG TPA: hypothetical protein VMV69_11705 [Pirellulales bacterium]|nr:hypothetical protein [Pirellulales bacterium]